MAADPGVDDVRVVRIDLLDEVLARPQRRREDLRSSARQLPAGLRERCIADLVGHLRTGQQCRDVHAGYPGDLAVPDCIERVRLRAVDDPIGTGVVADEKLQRQLDPGPIALQEGGIRRHLMLTIRAQNRAALTVGGPTHVGLGAESHLARVSVEADSEVHPLAGIPFQIREKSGDRLGVVPHVLARAGTAIDAFPPVEAS